MGKANKILNAILCLIVIFSSIQCGMKKSSECKSRKIQLLLEDIFKKKEYFFFNKIVQPIDSSAYNSTDSSLILIDSSKYFINLYSENIKIPSNEFYLHMSKLLDSSYPDSVKLREISSPSKQSRYSPMVGIELVNADKDTTNLKIRFGYSFGSVLWNEATYSYSFDDKNCKWIVSDSTMWRY